MSKSKALRDIMSLSSMELEVVGCGWVWVGVFGRRGAGRHRETGPPDPDCPRSRGRQRAAAPGPRQCLRPRPRRAPSPRHPLHTRKHSKRQRPPPLHCPANHLPVRNAIEYGNAAAFPRTPDAGVVQAHKPRHERPRRTANRKCQSPKGRAEANTAPTRPPKQKAGKERAAHPPGPQYLMPRIRPPSSSAARHCCPMNTSALPDSSPRRHSPRRVSPAFLCCGCPSKSFHRRLALAPLVPTRPSVWILAAPRQERR